MRRGANMRHSSFASAISAMAILWSGIAYGAGATSSDRDWDWCNGTADGGIPYDAQITGCSARIQSGEEPAANLFVAYYNRGLAYFRQGQYESAIGDFSEAIRLKPDNADAYYQRATAKAAVKRYEESLA